MLDRNGRKDTQPSARLRWAGAKEEGQRNQVGWRIRAFTIIDHLKHDVGSNHKRATGARSDVGHNPAHRGYIAHNVQAVDGAVPLDPGVAIKALSLTGRISRAIRSCVEGECA